VAALEAALRWLARLDKWKSRVASTGYLVDNLNDPPTDVISCPDWDNNLFSPAIVLPDTQLFTFGLPETIFKQSVLDTLNRIYATLTLQLSSNFKCDETITISIYAGEVLEVSPSLFNFNSCLIVAIKHMQSVS